MLYILFSFFNFTFALPPSPVHPAEYSYPSINYSPSMRHNMGIDILQVSPLLILGSIPLQYMCSVSLIQWFAVHWPGYLFSLALLGWPATTTNICIYKRRCHQRLYAVGKINNRVGNETTMFLKHYQGNKLQSREVELKWGDRLNEVLKKWNRISWLWWKSRRKDSSKTVSFIALFMFPCRWIKK